MNATDLCFTSALELGRLIRAGEVSPVELTEAVLERIEKLNPALNAFLTVTADFARQQARASEERARARANAERRAQQASATPARTDGTPPPAHPGVAPRRRRRRFGPGR